MEIMTSELEAAFESTVISGSQQLDPGEGQIVTSLAMVEY